MSAPSEITPQSLAVLGAVIVAALVNGLLLANAAVTVFIGNIAADYGWSHGEIAGAATLAFLGMGVGAPLFGPLVDRRGPRFVLLPLVIVSGLILSSFSFVGQSLPLFYAGHFLLGLSTPGAVAYSKLISTWFSSRRGIALTALGGGAFLGSAAIPLVAHLLLTHVGWQRAYLMFGALELLIAFPVLYLFFRERPAQADDSGVLSNEIRPDGAPPIGIAQALRSRTYWVVVGAQITGMFAQLGIGTHVVGIATERGLDAAMAAGAVSVLAVGGLVAQLATGVLLDRYDTPRVIAPFALLSIASLVLLYVSHGTLPVFLSLALLGLGVGGQTSMTSYFTTRYFGVRNFSTIYGSTMPVLLLFSAPAPIVVGAIFDGAASYQPALLLLGAALAASAVLFFLLAPYPYPVGNRAAPAPAPASAPASPEASVPQRGAVGEPAHA